MQIKQTKDFQKTFKNLQQDIKQLYQIQKNRFIANWRDPRLHIKKVKNFDHVFSLKITRRYRVFFYFQDSETAIFFDIDHRKDIYKKL